MTEPTSSGAETLHNRPDWHMPELNVFPLGRSGLTFGVQAERELPGESAIPMLSKPSDTRDANVGHNAEKEGSGSDTSKQRKT